MPGQGGGGGFLEDVLIAGGLLLVQCIVAGYIVFVGHLLALGADPLALIVVAGAASAAFFLPFAIALERKNWPFKISLTLVVQLVLIALWRNNCVPRADAFGDKEDDASNRFSHAQLVPWADIHHCSLFEKKKRLEKFDKACKYRQAKILGTVVCLVGAMALSFLQNPSTSSSSASDHLHVFITTVTEPSSYHDWILGCSYLFGWGDRLRPVHRTVGCNVGQLPCAIDNVHHNLCIGGRLHRDPSSHPRGQGQHGLPENRRHAHRRDRPTGRGVGWSMRCVSDMEPGQEGAAIRVSVWARADRLLCDPLRCPPRKNCQLRKHGREVLMFSGLYIVLWAKSKERLQLEGAGGAHVERALLS